MEARLGRAEAVEAFLSEVNWRSESLEEGWRRLKMGVDDLESQRIVLEEERKLLQDAESKLERERETFESRLRRDWVNLMPKELAKATKIKLNVGGQYFETTAAVLCRDRFSLLAAVCNVNGNIRPSARDGAYFFDRDWWIFRHILTYLRDGTLPEKKDLLMQLYNEAGFYRLGMLRYAIAMKLNGGQNSMTDYFIENFGLKPIKQVRNI